MPDAKDYLNACFGVGDVSVCWRVEWEASCNVDSSLSGRARSWLFSSWVSSHLEGSLMPGRIHSQKTTLHGYFRHSIRHDCVDPNYASRLHSHRTYEFTCAFSKSRSELIGIIGWTLLVRSDLCLQSLTGAPDERECSKFHNLFMCGWSKLMWCEALFFRISKSNGGSLRQKNLWPNLLLRILLKFLFGDIFICLRWNISKENGALMSLIIIILWFWKKINKFWGAKCVLSGQKCDFSEVEIQIFENIEISYVFSYKSLLPWCSAPSYHHHRWYQKSKVKYFWSPDQECWFLGFGLRLDLRFGLKWRAWLWLCELDVLKLGDREGS